MRTSMDSLGGMPRRRRYRALRRLAPWLAVVGAAACRTTAPPPVDATTTSPGAGAETNGAATPQESVAEESYVLTGGSLVLPDGTVLTREDGHFAFTSPPGPGESSSSSYIDAGDAQLIDDRWMFTRDLGSGTARIRPWRPRASEAGRQDVTMSLGDRLVGGDFQIEWVGVHGGSMAMTGKRILSLRARVDGHATDYWQYDGTAPATHDFATNDALHHFRLSIRSVKLEADARLSTITVRGQDVDLAKRATLGMTLTPGVWVFPSGLRIVYDRGTMCVTGKTTCVCTDHHRVRSANETVIVPEPGAVAAFGHQLRRVGSGIVVDP